jgi:hypothetical protein
MGFKIPSEPFKTFHFVSSGNSFLVKPATVIGWHRTGSPQTLSVFFLFCRGVRRPVAPVAEARAYFRTHLRRETMPFCPACGASVNGQFCPKCGAAATVPAGAGFAAVPAVSLLSLLLLPGTPPGRLLLAAGRAARGI